MTGRDSQAKPIHTKLRSEAATPAPAAAPTEALPSASLSVLFASGSADLTPAAIKTLGELGKTLTDPRLAAGKFRIEGYTDTVGTADYLASTYHVDPSKPQAISMGEDGALRGPCPCARWRCGAWPVPPAGQCA